MILARDFKKLECLREGDIYFTRHSIQTSWGDKIKSIFPLVWMPGGERLFSYAERYTKGIKIEIYKNAKRVKTDGADVVIEVPSRSLRSPRYKFKLIHVLFILSKSNLSTILQLKPGIVYDEEDIEQKNTRTLHEVYNIRYSRENEPEKSEVLTFYPHDVAGYLKIIKQELENNNPVPLNMNPFLLFSKKGIEFYKKLCNNVLVYNPEIKTNLRKLHLAEKSILLARVMGVFGYEKMVSLNYYDKKIENYS